MNLDRSREQWKNAALEMGVQLDAYAKLWGVKGANLAMNLRAVTREKQDYREFLRKFARCAEQIRVNDDEFDYVYYCYGLERYGNLPLIEPLEYVEEKRIRDFVIAIDTSASTKDGLVRRFIEKTYAILEQETSFFADMNVLIVQCDAAVTDVAHIANLRDLDALPGRPSRSRGWAAPTSAPCSPTWTTPWSAASWRTSAASSTSPTARAPTRPASPITTPRSSSSTTRQPPPPPRARLGHEGGARRNRHSGRRPAGSRRVASARERIAMDIRQAKDQIKNAMVSVTSPKDEFGNYRLPTERQRPVFLVGAPGIGKTAIMEQIAQELDVGLRVVLHDAPHTPKRARPAVHRRTKTYDGVEYDVSEYTMSEIIASVYDVHGGHRQARGHTVPRRDQLRV